MTELPALQLKTRCFYGIEAEGPNKGKRVLFVPSSVSSEHLSHVLAMIDKDRIDRVYYGAGNTRELVKETLLEVDSFCFANNKKLDVELFDPLDVLEIQNLETHKMIRSNPIIILLIESPDAKKHITKKVHNRTNYTKYIQDNIIVWVHTISRCRYETKLDDHLFELDTYIS